ncbi:MAG: 2-isopropylmalate synthase [Thermoproteota archaeon]
MILSKSEIIKIFDTTLRDGEQTPGISLTPEEKIQIAIQLDKLGVDTIEAGFPITSKGEAEAVKNIAELGLKSEICGLARAEPRDIETALNCNVDLVHVFIATSDIHMKHKLKMDRKQVIKTARDMVKIVKDRGVPVEFSAEDACRSDPEFLIKVFQEVSDVGVDRIDIADTVGIMNPTTMYDLVSKVKQVIKRPISMHCHNDFGLATANSLSGMLAGAERIHVAINGLGERAGNASLEEVVMASQNLYQKKTNVNTKLIYETSKLVTRLTGISPQPNKAIIGDNAFGHESGIHVHGIINMPITYEPLEPETVGRKRWIQAGKHAGTHGIKAQLEELGYDASEQQVKEILVRVKDLGDKGKKLTDVDLDSIARAILGKVSEEMIIELIDISVMTGIKSTPTASVKVVMEDETFVASETGVGPVDAAIKAIQKISDKVAHIRLKDFKIDAITGGTDALGEVVIKVEDDEGNVATARSSDGDIVVASAEAMIDGINKILTKKKIAAPKEQLANP